MAATVLLFGISDEERRKEIFRALLPLRFSIKVVRPEDYAQPLGVLAGVKGMEPVDTPYEGEELPGEMLLMAGMTGGQIDQLLAAFRSKKLPPVQLKAVLTSTNQHWKAPALFAELSEEHAYMTSHFKGKYKHQPSPEEKP